MKQKILDAGTVMLMLFIIWFIPLVFVPPECPPGRNYYPEACDAALIDAAFAGHTAQDQ